MQRQIVVKRRNFQCKIIK